MVAPTHTTPPTRPGPAAQSTPGAASSFLSPCRVPGWLSLLPLSLLVLGLLAGAALLSPGNLFSLPGRESPSLLPTGLPFLGASGATPSPVAPMPASPPASTTTTKAGLTPAVPCTSRDMGTFRQSITIGVNQHVCGNVVVFDGNVDVAGVVDGNVTVSGGTGRISGTVNGSITALDASLHLVSGATISGSIQVVGGSVTRDPKGVFVGGSIDQGIDPQHIVPSQWQAIEGPYDFPWSRLLFWVLASIAVTALFPRHLALVRRAARDSLPSAFLVGILSGIVGSILTIGLVFTCLGIPLALLVAAALAVASVVGTIALGLWLGERLLGQSTISRRAAVFPAMVGVTLLALAETIPCAGGVLTVLTSSAGLGASVLALLYARRHAVWTPDGLL
jgi:hypothetical protein